MGFMQAGFWHALQMLALEGSTYPTCVALLTAFGFGFVAGLILTMFTINAFVFYQHVTRNSKIHDAEFAEYRFWNLKPSTCALHQHVSTSPPAVFLHYAMPISVSDRPDKPISPPITLRNVGAGFVSSFTG